MNTEINCQSCKYYKDGYCEILELKPCYPQKGCDYFEERIPKVLDKIIAEIEQLPTIKCTEIRRIYINADDFKENVLAILNKYKAESEE